MNIRLLTLISVLAATGLAEAGVTVTLGPGNQGITAMNYSITGSTITINEYWGASGPGIIQFNGLKPGANYTVRKNIYNNTGFDWFRFASELLDPYLAGSEDDTYDVQPYPSWMPAGFSTSSDMDGLSFAQGTPIPRTSITFSSMIADEISDARDFLDFYNGLLPSGAIDTVSFGLRDNSMNQPFLIMQRPNAQSRKVPDAGGTAMLLGFGLAGLAAIRRRIG